MSTWRPITWRKEWSQLPKRRVLNIIQTMDNVQHSDPTMTQQENDSNEAPHFILFFTALTAVSYNKQKSRALLTGGYMPVVAGLLWLVRCVTRLSSSADVSVAVTSFKRSVATICTTWHQNKQSLFNLTLLTRMVFVMETRCVLCDVRVVISEMNFVL
jgi:hypothetical protein